MKNLEKIDKIFSKGLHSYERQPSPQAWEILEERLQKSKKKVLPIWLKYASAASVALLLGTGSNWLLRQNNEKNDLNTVTEKVVFKKEKTLPILEKMVPQIVKLKEGSKSKENLSKIANIEKPTKNQFIELSKNQIIEVETIKQVAKLPKIDSKNIEQNTIVIVLENIKPKREEETIILNMVETKREIEVEAKLNDGNTRKETRMSKIWQQLKRAKNGENVDWSEIGVKPQKILARVDAKIENVLTKEEKNEK